MSRQLEFIRGKSVYTEFKEGEIKKITTGRASRQKKELKIEIEVDKHTIKKDVHLITNDKRTICYIFPKEVDLKEEKKLTKRGKTINRTGKE